MTLQRCRSLTAAADNHHCFSHDQNDTVMASAGQGQAPWASLAAWLASLSVSCLALDLPLHGVQQKMRPQVWIATDVHQLFPGLPLLSFAAVRFGVQAAV